MARCSNSPSLKLGPAPEIESYSGDLLTERPKPMWAWRFPDDAPRHVTVMAPRRIIVVGDPHGCFDEFEDLMELCKFDPAVGDAVVVVGDLVNKGPKSLEMLRAARDREAVLSVRGNHEDNALRDWYKWKEDGEEPSGDTHWVMSMEEADVSYIEQLPYTCSIPQHDVLVVHAGLVPGKPLEEQVDGEMVRMRNLVVYKGETDPVPEWVASERDGDGVPWASVWTGPPHILFGHDALRKLQQYEGATGLDTGCAYGFHMTACILGPEPGKKELMQVKARAEYTKGTQPQPGPK